MTLCDQLGFEFGEIVNLAVKDYALLTVLAEHRLMTRRQIDDAQSPVTERYSVVYIYSLVIGSPVCEARSHFRDCILKIFLILVILQVDSDYATHTDVGD